jgi:hypothetical protein
MVLMLGLIGGWSHFRAGVGALEHLFAEKWFDVVLALFGTWLGYLLAKRHLEHFVSGIVEKMDAKYLELNRQIAFHKAVAAMLPELPQFYMRPTSTFSSHVATAVAEFTSWSTALDPTHTPEKSMELVGKEAYTLAAGLIKKGMGFKEGSTPNHEWIIDIADLPLGWAIHEVPDLSIYNWDTGAAVCRHTTMEEIARTATSVRFSWKWDMKDVPCGVYVGTVNLKIGDMLKIGSPLGERLKVFLKRENDQINQWHETIPWD